MRRLATALAATSMICGAPAAGWAQTTAPVQAPAPEVTYPNAPGPPVIRPEPAPAPAATEKKKEKEKPSIVETVGGTVGGVLGSAAGASGGPLGSAAAGMVGNKVGRSVGGFFSRIFGGKKKKAAEAPVQAVSAEATAQPAAAQTPAPVQ